MINEWGNLDIDTVTGNIDNISDPTASKATLMARRNKLMENIRKEIEIYSRLKAEYEQNFEE